MEAFNLPYLYLGHWIPIVIGMTQYNKVQNNAAQHKYKGKFNLVMFLLVGYNGTL